MASYLLTLLSALTGDLSVVDMLFDDQILYHNLRWYINAICAIWYQEREG